MRLLAAVGDAYWAKSLEEDIRLWKTASDTSHHLSAYGGMGSFNDVYICAANKHRVTPAQERWAQALFDWLKATCYYIAQHPREKITADTLLKEVGRHDSTLTAFVGGDKAPITMRGRVVPRIKLQGYRCLDCGYAETSPQCIEGAIADDIIPAMVFQACEAGTLRTLVDSVLALNVPGIDAARQDLMVAAKSSRIVIAARTDWMRKCPECGKTNTAVYRWRSGAGSPLRLIPSDDNLAMRT